MHFSDLPDDILFAFIEQLEEESDINVLSRSNRHLHQLLNPFLYQYNIRHHSAYGMWAVIRLKCEAAVLDFIAHGANVRVLERENEPVDRRYGNNPEGEEDDDDRPPIQHSMFQFTEEGFIICLSRISAPKPKEPHIPPYRRDPASHLSWGLRVWAMWES